MSHVTHVTPKAVCCSVLKCVSVCCSALQCGESCHTYDSTDRVLRLPAFTRSHECCSVLQRLAACCNVLQRVAA